MRFLCVEPFNLLEVRGRDHACDDQEVIIILNSARVLNPIYCLRSLTSPSRSPELAIHAYRTVQQKQPRPPHFARNRAPTRIVTGKSS